MDTTAESPAIRASHVGPHLRTLLFAALGGAAAWAVHLLAAYFLASAACWTGSGGFVTGIHAVTALMFLIAIAAGVVSWRVWRAAGEAHETAMDGRQGVSTFIGVWGIAASALFALLILVGGFAGFFLDPCRTI